jgi:cytochrome c-type biogenesis protein CcmH
VARDLTGDHEGALADWLALLADTPKGAVWQADLVRTIAQVGKINHISVDERIVGAQTKGEVAPTPVEQRPAIAEAIPGPSASDLQAANGMTPSVQNQMAEGMVAKLEARLRDEPGNTSGWLMLIRSRVTLGQADKAKAALAQAVAADPGHAAQLRAQAGLLGVH